MCSCSTFITLFVALVLVACSSARAQTPASAPEAVPSNTHHAARDAALRAQAHFEAEDFRGAALEYERAYGLLEAGERRNAVLNNLAVSYERLREYQRALDCYQRYLQEASPTLADRDEVLRIMDGLRDLLGSLRVESNVPAEVWVDEQPRGRTPLTLQLDAGDHVLALRAEGFEDQRRGVSVAPRSLQTVTMSMLPEDHYRGVHRRYFYGGVVLSVTTLATAAALGGRALSLHNDAEARAERVETPRINTGDDEDQIRRLGIASDVTLGVGILLSTTTLVLGFLTDFTGADRTVQRRFSRAPVQVSLGPMWDGRRAGMWLRGHLR